MSNYIKLINKYIEEVDTKIQMKKGQLKIKGFNYDGKIENEIKKLCAEKYDLNEIRLILLKNHIENEVT